MKSRERSDCSLVNFLNKVCNCLMGKVCMNGYISAEAQLSLQLPLEDADSFDISFVG